MPRSFDFLIEALGFTAAGVTMEIPIVTLDDAAARMQHHRVEFEKAWRDYYGISQNVRIVPQTSPVGTVVESDGYPPHFETSVFMICADGGNVVG